MKATNQIFNTEAQRLRGTEAVERDDPIAPNATVKRVRLGDVCEVLDSLRKPITKKDRVPGQIPYYGATCIQDYVNDYIFDEPLVLLGEDGARWGADECSAYMIRGKAWVNNHAHVLRPTELLNHSWLTYYLCHTDLDCYITGTTVRKLTQEKMRSIEIPLPPLAHQKRIAAVLDKICEMKRNVEARLQKLDLLVKARFNEMFGDPVVNPKKWPVAKIKDFADVKIGPFGSVLHKEDYIIGGHALVNPSHMENGKIVVDESLTISEEKYAELAVYHLQVGDVVIARRGEIGRCALVEEEGLFCGTGSMFVRISRGCRPDYLQRVISYPTYSAKLDFGSVGVTMKNINAGMIADSQVPLPPIETQRTFAAFVEKVEGLKATAKRELEQVDLLYRAKLQEYFG